MTSGSESSNSSVADRGQASGVLSSHGGKGQRFWDSAAALQDVRVLKSS